MQHLILSVIRSYRPAFWAGIGLEGALESSEELIDSGWMRLGCIKDTIDPSDGQVKPFYCFLQWNPFKRKYVRAGSKDPQLAEFARRWQEHDQ